MFDQMTKQAFDAAYDSIINHIGDFGTFQRRLMALCFVAGSFHGFWILTPIFSMAEVDFRCAVPELSNETFEIRSETHAQLVNLSIPYDPKTDQYSQCFRFAQKQTANGANVTSNRLVACSQWVYSKEVFYSSIVTELDLVCDREIYTVHAKMMTVGGLMLGSLLDGPLSDHFGRKKIFRISISLHMLVAVLSTFMMSVPVLLISRLIGTTLTYSLFTCLFVLGLETASTRRRVELSLMPIYSWGVSFLMVVLLAYFIRDWWTLSMAIEIPKLLITITVIWFIPESPRWLITKKRHEEARATLEHIASVNKVALFAFDDNENDTRATADKDPAAKAGVLEHFVRAGQKLCHGEIGNGVSGEAKETREQGKSLILLLKSPRMMWRIAVLCATWSVLSMVYYGVTLNVGTLIEGDLFLNVFTVAFLDNVTVLVTHYALHKSGRKIVFSTGIIAGGAFCLAATLPVFVDGAPPCLGVLFANVGKFFVTCAFNIAFMFTSEQLPTPVRQTGLGFCSFVGRVGGMISPYIATLGTNLGGLNGKAMPLILFGLPTVLVGILSLVLPETGGRKLPETVKEAETMKI